MNEAVRGTTIKSRCVPANASVSILVNSESGSNEIDETDLQYEKHDEQRI
jgi:hypothetical protein